MAALLQGPVLHFVLLYCLHLLKLETANVKYIQITPDTFRQFDRNCGPL